MVLRHVAWGLRMNCDECGAELFGLRKRFCSVACGNKYWRKLERKRNHTAEQRPTVHLPIAERPKVRGDCVDGPRPCPWVSCVYHLHLDVLKNGHLKVNQPDHEPWELTETCALDVADRGETKLETIAGMLNLTRERVRQIEVRATEAIETPLQKVRD